MRVFLVFQNSRNDHWWNIFNVEGYQHVDLLIYRNNIMTCISQSIDNLQIYSSNQFEQLKNKEVYDNIKVYEITNHNYREIKNKLFMLGTCVGMCKKFLGIKNPFIFTPYQLLKYLKKRNKVCQIHLLGQH